MPSHASPLPNVLNGRRLVVPSYQRPYAWSERQLEDEDGVASPGGVADEGAETRCASLAFVAVAPDRRRR